MSGMQAPKEQLIHITQPFPRNQQMIGAFAPHRCNDNRCQSKRASRPSQLDGKKDRAKVLVKLSV
jgi:hypothetical protein